MKCEKLVECTSTIVWYVFIGLRFTTQHTKTAPIYIMGCSVVIQWIVMHENIFYVCAMCMCILWTHIFADCSSDAQIEELHPRFTLFEFAITKRRRESAVLLSILTLPKFVNWPWRSTHIFSVRSSISGPEPFNRLRNAERKIVGKFDITQYWSQWWAPDIQIEIEQTAFRRRCNWSKLLTLKIINFTRRSAFRSNKILTFYTQRDSGNSMKKCQKQ